ncbi:MAG: hypothetical protein EOP06_31250 [Proteobacteria bacterium]|nr:MAG: hypothetical protein EOP06_31250 [Pseudomonadota bacterium]
MERRKARIFTRSDDSENLHWLGLVIEERREVGAIYLTPTIGFRFQEIHRVIAHVEGEADHPYLPPKVAQNIGYLGPEKSALSLRITDKASAGEAALELAHRIERDGQAFLSNASLPWIIQHLAELTPWEDASERILVGLHLSGKSETELRNFSIARTEQGRNENRFYQRFEAFSRRFFSKINSLAGL